MFDKQSNFRLTDEDLIKALTFQRNKIDIYVSGFGPSQLGVGFLSQKVENVLKIGTKLGRQRKGKY